MLDRLRRNWDRKRLKDSAFDFLFEPDDSGEVVSLDCETTGLDVRKAEILSIGAIKIRGNRILTSQRLELLARPTAEVSASSVTIHLLRPMDVRAGISIDDAIRQLLRFIGSRPLVGYYIEFDVAMVNKYLRPMLGISLPNRQIEVSSLYYDMKFRSNIGRHVDLRLDSIMDDLELPHRTQHDAFNDALMAAMMYVKLTGKFGRPGDG